MGGELLTPRRRSDGARRRVESGQPMKEMSQRAFRSARALAEGTHGQDLSPLTHGENPHQTVPQHRALRLLLVLIIELEVDHRPGAHPVADLAGTRLPAGDLLHRPDHRRRPHPAGRGSAVVLARGPRAMDSCWTCCIVTRIVAEETAGDGLRAYRGPATCGDRGQAPERFPVEPARSPGPGFAVAHSVGEGLGTAGRSPSGDRGRAFGLPSGRDVALNVSPRRRRVGLPAPAAATSQFPLADRCGRRIEHPRSTTTARSSLAGAS